MSSSLGIMSDKECSMFEYPYHIEEAICGIPNVKQLLYDTEIRIIFASDKKTITVIANTLFRLSSEKHKHIWNFTLANDITVPSVDSLRHVILRLAKRGIVLDSIEDVISLENRLGNIFSNIDKDMLDYRFGCEDNNIYLIHRNCAKTLVYENIRSEAVADIPAIIDNVNKKVEILCKYGVAYQPLAFELMASSHLETDRAIIDVDKGTLEFIRRGNRIDYHMKIDTGDQNTIACIKTFFDDIFRVGLTINAEHSITGVLTKFRTARDNEITYAFCKIAKDIVEKTCANEIRMMMEEDPIWMGHLLHWTS